MTDCHRPAVVTDPASPSLQDVFGNLSPKALKEALYLAFTEPDVDLVPVTGEKYEKISLSVPRNSLLQLVDLYVEARNRDQRRFIPEHAYTRSGFLREALRFYLRVKIRQHPAYFTQQPQPAKGGRTP